MLAGNSDALCRCLQTFCGLSTVLASPTAARQGIALAKVLNVGVAVVVATQLQGEAAGYYFLNAV